MSRGAVVWLTGLPASGKSTLARRIQRRLWKEGRCCALLDGDEVRSACAPSAGYSEVERDAFYRALGRLAALFARQGLVALVPATAHRAAYRDEARQRAPRFVEVLVSSPAAECEKRDKKGLYARARAGGAPALPGFGVRYEPPRSPEVTARGGRDVKAVERVCEALGRARAPARHFV